MNSRVHDRFKRSKKLRIGRVPTFSGGSVRNVGAHWLSRWSVASVGGQQLSLLRYPTETMMGGKSSKPKLLSGGNPQIAKADGDEPVQAYIKAMPGWKHDVGRWLDDVVTAAVPHARKAVRWNTPFYGIEGQGWFLSCHCFTKYVKISFLNAGCLHHYYRKRPSTSKCGRSTCMNTMCSIQSR